MANRMIRIGEEVPDEIMYLQSYSSNDLHY